MKTLHYGTLSTTDLTLESDHIVAQGTWLADLITGATGPYVYWRNTGDNHVVRGEIDADTDYELVHKHHIVYPDIESGTWRDITSMQLLDEDDQPRSLFWLRDRTLYRSIFRTGGFSIRKTQEVDRAWNANVFALTARKVDEHSVTTKPTYIYYVPNGSASLFRAVIDINDENDDTTIRDPEQIMDSWNYDVMCGRGSSGIVAHYTGRTAVRFYRTKNSGAFSGNPTLITRDIRTKFLAMHGSYAMMWVD